MKRSLDLFLKLLGISRDYSNQVVRQSTAGRVDPPKDDHQPAGSAAIRRLADKTGFARGQDSALFSEGVERYHAGDLPGSMIKFQAAVNRYQWIQANWIGSGVGKHKTSCYVWMSNLCIELKDKGNAMKYLSRARSGWGLERDHYLGIGMSYMALREYKMAAGMFRSALRQDRYFHESYDWLGAAYRKTGELKLAEKVEIQRSRYAFE